MTLQPIWALNQIRETDINELKVLLFGNTYIHLALAQHSCLDL